MPPYRTLLFTVDRGVAIITLNRPRQRNAIGDGMRDELAGAYRASDRDDSVRAIVLTGTPPAFCAGADLSDGEQTFAEPGRGFSAAGIEVPAWSLSKPVIAAVNGHALGLGLTLALQCESGSSPPTRGTAWCRSGAASSVMPTRTGSCRGWPASPMRPKSC
jgi:enoyl-CoA hydratase/carnithine racemase